MSVTIVVLVTQIISPGQVLLVALITKIDTGGFLFFFRQPDETGQPLQDAIKSLQGGGKKAARLLCVGLWLTEEIIHSCRLCLWGGMVFAGRGLSGAHHRSTARAVKKHPD